MKGERDKIEVKLRLSKSLLFHMSVMCGMYDRHDRYGMYGRSSYGM